MARSFNGTTQYLSRTTIPASAAPLTVSIHFKPTAGSGGKTLWALADTAGTANYFRLEYDEGAGNLEAETRSTTSGGAVMSTVGGITEGAWNHGAAVYAAANSRTVYGNGTAGTTNTSSVTPLDLDTEAIGVLLRSTTAQFFAGELADYGLWDVALTAAEITALSKGVSPLLIRPASLVSYAPLGGRLSPEPDLITGVGFALTAAPTYADGPRLYRPRGRSLIVVPSSAGQALALPTIASTETLAAPTLAPGTAPVTLPAIASTAALLAPTLSAGAVALGLPSIATGAVLSAPVLTAGVVDVSLPAIASMSSLAAPSVAAGGVAVGLPTIAAGSTVSAPALAPGGLDLGLPTIASGAVLTAPAVAPGVASVALPAIGTTVTLFAPTVVGADAIALPTIGSTAALAAPTLTAGAVSVSLPAIASASATYAPTLAGVAALALPTIASQSALHGPALVPGVMALTLPTLASTSALFSQTIIDGILPTYTVLRIGAARAGRNGVTARAGRSGITARTHLSE
jgi:hypothetical protein